MSLGHCAFVSNKFAWFGQGGDTELSREFGSCISKLLELGATQVQQTVVEDQSIQLSIPESFLTATTRHGAVGCHVALQQVHNNAHVLD